MIVVSWALLDLEGLFLRNQRDEVREDIQYIHVTIWKNRDLRGV